MTKTRSIIGETIIGKDEPLQPFRSAMTQDTEDVVARLDATVPPFEQRVRNAYQPVNPDGPDAIKLIQSLSDRIDGLKGALALIDRQAEIPTKPMLFVGTKRRQEHYLLRYALSSIKDTARAALHQEGIAP